MGLFVYRKKRPSRDSAQKTKIPPPMMPKRTAHPVAKTLAKRPAAPPLLIEPRLVGDGDGWLLVREDEREDEEGVTLDWMEDMLGGGQVQEGVTLDDKLELREDKEGVTLDWVEEELEGREGGTEEELEEMEGGGDWQTLEKIDSASVRSAGEQLALTQVRTACWYCGLEQTQEASSMLHRVELPAQFVRH
jgi:hypothetical protein